MFELRDDLKTKYKVLNQYNVKEENLEVVELSHIKTAARFVLFICDDENRVFNIVFKTPVNDSKGTPHILEHSVLCGSRKYNVKDPFVELAKSSMNTFLNAMTFPDKTCYPVASANLKDFHNLVDVYLDAVFYPNAVKNEKIFKQEGWHYELDSKDAELKVNGVVFNEMRGVYSDPDSILDYSVLNNLYSGTNYAYESGGNPNEIYNLTYDEFVDFHKKYYSPSNSIVYYYGKLDFNDELDYIDREYFQHFDKINVNAEFSDCKDIVLNKEKIDYYSIDSEDNKDNAYLAYSFSYGKEKTSLKVIVSKIIDYVLFSSSSAILKEKFLNEGYGESVSSRFESGIKNAYYSIISQNIKEDKKRDFVKLFDDSIQKMINEGLDIDKFKAGINSVYFDYAEGEYSSFPRGLYLSLVSLDTYLYGDGITTLIEYEEAFNEIRKNDLNSKDNIFIETLKELFIDNNHRCINILRPKMGYSEEKDRVIKNELVNRKSALSEKEIEKIITDMKELKEYQSSKDSSDDLKCIPTISLSDIDRDKKTIDYEIEVNENVDTIISYKNDKDIVYVGLKFDITDLKDEEIYLFALINIIISKVDLISESFHEFNNYVDINTGGLSIGFYISNDKLFFTLDIKTEKDKISHAFNIFYKLFSDIQFVDSKRINILLNECKQNSLLYILSSGHISAMGRSISSFDLKNGILDKVGSSGIGFYKFISTVCDKYLENSDIFNDSLDLLYKKLHRKKMYLSFCANKKYHDSVIDNFKSFTDNVIKNKMKRIYTERDESRLQDNISKIDKFVNFASLSKNCKNEAIVTPNDINFCALSGQFPKELFSGRLFVLRTLFNYEYLWTNIRVLGGAYGCMTRFYEQGFYSFCSYRDPNLSNTNNIYLGVDKFLKSFEKNGDEIKKYIIGSIGAYDNPASIVDNYRRNVAAYFNGLSDEEYNKRRHDVLDITKNDIRDLYKIFDCIENGSRCALISASKVSEAEKEYDQVWQLIE